MQVTGIFCEIFKRISKGVKVSSLRWCSHRPVSVHDTDVMESGVMTPWITDQDSLHWWSIQCNDANILCTTTVCTFYNITIISSSQVLKWVYFVKNIWNIENIQNIISSCKTIAIVVIPSHCVVVGIVVADQDDMV